MKFTIEHDIPLPPRRPSAGYASALRRMAVGDSVFIPDRIPRHVQSTVNMLRIPGRFTCRSMDGGVRVWRFE